MTPKPPPTLESVAKRGNQLATLRRLRQEIAARMSDDETSNSDFAALAIRLVSVMGEIDARKAPPPADEVAAARKRRTTREQARPERRTWGEA